MLAEGFIVFHWPITLKAVGLVFGCLLRVLILVVPPHVMLAGEGFRARLLVAPPPAVRYLGVALQL